MSNKKILIVVSHPDDEVLESFNRQLLHKQIEFKLDQLSTKLINFTELTLDEKKMILEWRNSDIVKKWMYNRDNISLENHLKYIDSLNSRDDRVYFLLKNETSSLGVIDLTGIKKERSAELGIYANPTLKGYGSLLMHEIVKYAFNELNLKVLYANVYEDNIKAINLYKKFNFKEINNNIVIGKNIICMALKRS